MNIPYLLAAASLLLAGQAHAQDAATTSDAAMAGDATTPSTTDNPTSFRGFRAEAQVGYGRFQSQGTHDYKLGYGGTVGWDGQIGEKIVIGPEASYWRARGENVTTDVNGGVIANKQFNEIGAAVRAGYLVTPALLAYGKIGYVRDDQRRSYSGVGPTQAGAYYDTYHTDGVQYGGGAEYSLNKRFYLNAEYKYSDYDNHTAQQRVLVGAGIRFP